MTDDAVVVLMVEAGDVAGVRTWISQGGDPNVPQARHGSLLHDAANCGHVELVRLLLENGAHVDSCNSFGDTPLICAASSGSTEAARLLLNHGAKVAYTFQLPDNEVERSRMAQDRDRFLSHPNSTAFQSQLRALLEQSPLEMRGTMEELQAELIESIWSRRFELQEKNAIDDCGNFPTLKMLVSEFGADINRIDEGGETPLMRFVGSNDVAAVKWLLENGALVDQTSTGETALFDAIKTDNLELIELLIDAGANLNQYDCDMCVPLQCAQSIDAASLLLKRGANPTLRDQADFPCWYFVRDPHVQQYLEAAAKTWKGTD